MNAVPGHRCGTVVLAGRPNVGKSTLLNALIGQKLSIVTPKAQTTRQRIAGVLTRPGFQLILQDTPGFGAPAGRRLNQAMHREAVAAIATADAAILITAATRWTAEDDAVLAQLVAAGAPVVAAVNKIDRVRPKERLLPLPGVAFAAACVRGHRAGLGAAWREPRRGSWTRSSRCCRWRRRCIRRTR